MSGSYRPDEETGGLPAELRRLEAQAALSWDEELRRLEEAGLGDAQELLEVGSGPGFITRRLLERFPRMRLTALEADPRMREVAREHCGDAGGRHRQVGAVFPDTGLPAGGFDVVFGRMLFQHLPDMRAGVMEARRLLRPGGLLTIVDIDIRLWGLVEPYRPELATIQRKAEQRQLHNGGNRLLTRDLYRALREHGFEAPRIDAFTYHSETLGLEPFLAQIHPSRLEPAMEQGLISPVEYALAHVEYQRFVSTPGAFILMIGLCFQGRRPLTEGPGAPAQG